MSRRALQRLLVLAIALGTACRSTAGEPAAYPNALLLAEAQFVVGADGKASTTPGAARFEILTRSDGKWQAEAVEDPQSNVFHKAMPYTGPGGRQGILTLSGDAAAIKLWQRKDGAFASTTLWQKRFGGKHDRMRDAEVGDLFGRGPYPIAVATHDQGVVAVVRPLGNGRFEAAELSREAKTFVHEIELGDLDGDGVLEIYATPSEPNRVDASSQSGKVVRYTPSKKTGAVTVADLGQRHAKEILVDDVDGDRRQELYVAVEGVVQGKDAAMQLREPVEIRRYDAGTAPGARNVIATIDDRFCRFLTAGDVDGDGKKEMVATAFSTGVWLLRPPADAGGAWARERIDADSSGFEHAALLTDLDGDKRGELYVASDRHGEIRRYRWLSTGIERTVIWKRSVPDAVITFNLTAVPVSMLRAAPPPQATPGK
jgi:hypothetical protein